MDLLIHNQMALYSLILYFFMVNVVGIVIYIFFNNMNT